MRRLFLTIDAIFVADITVFLLDFAVVTGTAAALTAAPLPVGILLMFGNLVLPVFLRGMFHTQTKRILHGGIWIIYRRQMFRSNLQHAHVLPKTNLSPKRIFHGSIALPSQFQS